MLSLPLPRPARSMSVTRRTLPEDLPFPSIPNVLVTAAFNGLLNVSLDVLCDARYILNHDEYVQAFCPAQRRLLRGCNMHAYLRGPVASGAGTSSSNAYTMLPRMSSVSPCVTTTRSSTTTPTSSCCCVTSCTRYECPTACLCVWTPTHQWPQRVHYACQVLFVDVGRDAQVSDAALPSYNTELLIAAVHQPMDVSQPSKPYPSALNAGSTAAQGPPLANEVIEVCCVCMGS